MGIRITPSILNADFSHLDQEIARIAGVSDLLHLDVMDNVFVPNARLERRDLEQGWRLNPELLSRITQIVSMR